MTDHLQNAVNYINKINISDRHSYISDLLHNAYDEVKQIDSALESSCILRQILIACGKLWAQELIDF